MKLLNKVFFGGVVWFGRFRTQVAFVYTDGFNEYLVMASFASGQIVWR